MTALVAPPALALSPTWTYLALLLFPTWTYLALGLTLGLTP
jgi:hypothetical protein